MFMLANVTPSDVFYDLGCGDASILIFAVKDRGVRRAVGFENDPVRNRIARQRVREEGLSDRISIEGDMYDANLSEADTILSMHMETDERHDELFNATIRKGTRLIKHDLPLLGFDFDAVDYPFYLIRFPLRRMRTSEEWASRVMGRKVNSVQELWQELLYYTYEKGYRKWDVKKFERILRSRMSEP